jgi:hypothetical protein
VAHARVTLNRAWSRPYDEQLAGHHRLDAVPAHLLEMNGDPEAAIVHDEAAAGRTTSVAERNYLVMRAARLAAQTAECGHENRPKRARDNALMLP